MTRDSGLLFWATLYILLCQWATSDYAGNWEMGKICVYDETVIENMKDRTGGNKRTAKVDTAWNLSASRWSSFAGLRIASMERFCDRSVCIGLIVDHVLQNNVIIGVKCEGYMSRLHVCYRIYYFGLKGINWAVKCCRRWRSNACGHSKRQTVSEPTSCWTGSHYVSEATPHQLYKCSAEARKQPVSRS